MSIIMWRWRKRKVYRKRRASSVTQHYLEHKEQTRELVLTRLRHFNQHYQFTWNRVSIRNQRRCWGSCTSLKNLNFNYKLLLLPPHLRDYIIVHELCHLKELNHSQAFWDLVAEQLPEYRFLVKELKTIDKGGHSIAHLTKVQDQYQSYATTSMKPVSDVATMSQLLLAPCGHSVVCNCSVDTSSS